MGQRFWQHFVVFLVVSAASYAQMLGENGINSARGNPYGFDFPTGTFISGTINHAPANSTTVTFSVHGTLNTITVTTGVLAYLACAPISCFTFSGGTITVVGQLQFTNVTMQGGFVSLSGSNPYSFTLAANVLSHAPIQTGTIAFDFAFSGTKITQGEGGVQGEFIAP